MSISFEQYYRGIVPVSIDRSNFSVKLNYNATLTTTSGQLGINLGNANTWTAEQTFNDTLTVGGSAGLDSANIGLYPYATSGIVLGENMSFISIWGTIDNVGGWIGENYVSIQMGMYNRTTTTQGALAGSKWMMNLGVNLNGAVYTFVPTNYDIGVSASENASVRNTLDDGSGNMSIAGNLSVTGTGGIFATANTWSALQTFGNNISIGGATLDVSSLASGDVLYYNGTNWINEALGQFGVSGISGNTTAYLVGNVELKSGSGISISQSSPDITIGNTGVLSLQGDTGAVDCPNVILLSVSQFKYNSAVPPLLITKPPLALIRGLFAPSKPNNILFASLSFPSKLLSFNIWKYLEASDTAFLSFFSEKYNTKLVINPELYKSLEYTSGSKLIISIG